MSTRPPDTTNYAKFQTRNPLARLLFDRFYKALRQVVADLGPESLLDAGCGEGETLERLSDLMPREVHGLDCNPACVEFAAARLPACRFHTGDVCRMDFPDGRFDTVLCLEVLEHLADPVRAMRELARVSRRHIVVSVPNEPVFRLTNLARGRYLRRWGDHPEHCQHWNRASLTEFLAGATDVASVRSSYPWLIAVCRKSASASRT
ncbi:MAG: class I SAM-dependent methyltransferase [candidate division WOR-3 bacterium]|nr:MAG: class I SAM-dependent methyltransferase [candidate division WOR-3 bacterium]